MALLSLRDIRVAFGGPPLLEAASLQIEPGERMRLLGRNGTGKSTLLTVVNGEIAPDEGEIVRQQGVKVALVPQEIPARSFGDGVRSRVRRTQDRGGEGDLPPGPFSGRRFRHPFRGDAAPGVGRPGARPRRGHTAPRRAHEPPGHRLDRLARGLPAAPRRHLFLRHARPAFLRKLATRIVELDRGRLSTGSATTTRSWRRRRASRPKAHNRRFDRKLAKEEEWIRRASRPAHQERGTGARAREDARGAAGAAGAAGSGPHGDPGDRPLRQDDHRGGDDFWLRRRG